jgi:hypothetical protein
VEGFRLSAVELPQRVVAWPGPAVEHGARPGVLARASAVKVFAQPPDGGEGTECVAVTSARRSAREVVPSGRGAELVHDVLPDVREACRVVKAEVRTEELGDCEPLLGRQLVHAWFEAPWNEEGARFRNQDTRALETTASGLRLILVEAEVV